MLASALETFEWRLLCGDHLAGFDVGDEFGLREMNRVQKLLEKCGWKVPWDRRRLQSARQSFCRFPQQQGLIGTWMRRRLLQQQPW